MMIMIPVIHHDFVKLYDGVRIRSLYTPGSASLLCHVKKGEHVWVQTSGGTSVNYMHDWRDSMSFMGFLLQKD
jgi:hypothetical protein